jgi:hypothetical protein
MRNQETPKTPKTQRKLTFKDTAEFVAKATKVMTEGTRKIVQFKDESKKKRIDPSGETGESLNLKNPYLAGATASLAYLKNKEKSIKEFFPKDPEIITSPESVSEMVEESYEDLASSMIKSFEDKGLDIKKLEDFIEKNLRDAHILGAKIHDLSPNNLSSIQIAIDKEMRKTKDFILSKKEFWNK